MTPKTNTAQLPKDVLLDLQDVKVSFETREGTVTAVNGVSYKVRPGEVLGIVGESGSGKSVTVRAIMRLLAKNAIEGPKGSIRFNPNGDQTYDLHELSRDNRQIRALRGNRIGMIFQEPMTALSPVHSIGSQISRTVMLHRKSTKAEARARARDLLERVQLPNPDLMLDRFPHQLSGGMRQRAMIALALACDPSLLIADEPTTALDVTTEAQILELLKSLQAELGMAIIFITHNFGVVADIADRVAVMYLGQIVETGDVDDIFYAPKHPYTQALLQSIPRLGQKKVRRLKTIRGSVPDPYHIPSGCPFHNRCDHADAALCTQERPPLRGFDNGQEARCHFAGQLPEASL
ncbi:ABC transporter ATP-binding protein [Flavimaricola marinus]|uniref:Oligopeptide transport ATP-binding protein OppD n=1 Tax=Flavimaricola marinus TaxID=1819565 RepID=A0A238LCC6_9RHOB|nr:ABC transporter ATP-binding protein [Flavimaricola marinus]SMY07271.1 Oligopeptide transport ATP-binding protein OppD [Flavimaricola marinus]